MYKFIEVLISNSIVLTGKQSSLRVVKKNRFWIASVMSGREVDATAVGSSLSDALAKLDAECSGMMLPPALNSEKSA